MPKTTIIDGRANDLRVGDTYIEDGFDDDEAVHVTKIDYHGDTVLITGTSPDRATVETGLDIDCGVEIRRPA